MTIREINPSEVYDGAPYGISQAVVDERSGHVFVSGQVAWDVHGHVSGGSYGEQTTLALQNLRTVLRAAGSDVSEVLSLRVYIRGELAEHIEECLPAFAALFGPKRPALTGIGVASLATPDTLVEIEAVARTRATA